MYSIFGICGIYAIGFTYSFCVYFLRFFCLSDREKLVIFCGFSFILFSILLILIKTTYPRSVNFLIQISKKQKLGVLLLAIGFSLSSFLVSLPYIPTVISLELTIPVNTSKQYDILEINKIDSIDQKHNRISPYKVTMDGKWIIQNNSLSILSEGGESLKYSDSSNYGISLLFKKSPESGIINVNWNGINQIIDLQSDASDLAVVDLPFSYLQMSPDRSIWIFILLISNFVSLFFLIFLFFTINDLLHDFRAFYSTTNIFQKIILASLPLVICLGFADFSALSSGGVFYLRRKNSNSLVDLVDSSLAYLQVYYKFSEYFNGYELIVPKEMLTEKSIFPKNEITKEDLTKIGLLGSVQEETYSYELSTNQIERIKEKQTIIIPPSIDVIPYEVKFIIEPGNQNNVVCMWSESETIYFIPVMNDFDCQKGK